MSETLYQVPYQGGNGRHRNYYENEKGGFRDEFGTTWSPPVAKITKTWAKTDFFRFFGETILATASQVDWRVQSRMRKVNRVTAYYPGYTPVDRAGHDNFRLFVDLEASPFSVPTIVWFNHFGKYTFTADRDQAEHAQHVLQHVIEQLLTIGRVIEECGARQPSTMLPLFETGC